MTYKKLVIVFIAFFLIIAGILALLNDKKILKGQYARSNQLTLQGDQLVLNKNYTKASEKYRLALTIDPKNSKLWSKFIASERKLIVLQLKGKIQEQLKQQIKNQLQQQMKQQSGESSLQTEKKLQSTPAPSPPVEQPVNINPPADESEHQGAVIIDDEGC